MLVKQVRIPVLLNNGDDGICFELCAGLIDKKKSNIKIAQEEILEEMGYLVPLEKIKLFKKLRNSVGSTGNNIYLYQAEITEIEKMNDGGGLESEDIEVFELPYREVSNFAFNLNVNIDSSTMFI